MLHRVQVTETSEHQQFRGDYVNQAFMVELLTKKPLLKDTNKKKRLAWAKKHEQWTLDRWKSVLWSDESKFAIFGSNHCVFARHRVGERMISACVVSTVKHGGGGVMVWGCFAADTDAFCLLEMNVLWCEKYKLIPQQQQRTL